MLKRLVLRKDIDKALAEVVTVLVQELGAPVAERGDDLPDLGLRRQRGYGRVRHWAAVPASGGSRGARAIGRELPPARLPGS